MARTYEPHCSEFIGIACYIAEQEFQARELPLGVIEKMVAIARDHLGVSIPGTERTITYRGVMNVYHPPSIIAYQQVTYLRYFQSRYFQKEERGQGLFFKSSAGFVENLQQITSRHYYGDYEAACRALLEIWSAIKLEGLALVDVLRSGDAGVSFLVADLELAVRQLNIYLNRSLRAPGNTVAKGELKKRFEGALDSYRDKRKAIRENAHLIGHALKTCRSPKAKVLISELKLPDPEMPLFRILDCLYKFIEQAGRDVLGADRWGPVVQKALSNLCKWTYGSEAYEHLGGDADPTETAVQFVEVMELWLRALSGKSTSEVKVEHKLINFGPDRIHSAVCDVKDSTKTLSSLEHQFGRSSEVLEWIGRIRDVVCGWWALFDGTLSSSALEGDKFFSCFKSNWQSIYSSALAVLHTQILTSYAIKPMKYLIRVGLAKGETPHASEVGDFSGTASFAFHMVDRKDLAKYSGSLLLAHDSIVEGSDLLKPPISTALDNEVYLIVDMNPLIDRLVARMTVS